ncbi:MAG: ABC transporter permease [Patulibacter sp.]
MSTGIDPQAIAAAAPSRRRSGGAARWLAARIFGGIGVLWAAATLTFLLQTVTQHDRARQIISQQTGTTANPTKEVTARVNHEFGFDHSVLHQYADYIGGLARGDFGVSYYQHQTVTSIIGGQIGPTLVLTFVSLLLAWAIAVSLTLLGAGRRNAWSAIANFLQMLSASLPTYWVGSILLVVFGVQLGIFPVVGGSPLVALVLPAFTMALPVSGFLGQVIQEEFDAALEQPFVTTSRSRGITDFGVRTRHVLRHATLPGLTLSGWAVGYLFSNAVLVELVFARPGIGSVLTTAASNGDVPLVTGVVLASAAIYVAANIIVDFLYGLVDPRLRVSS